MFRKLFFFLLIWLCSGALRAQSTTNWQLIFEDEFEGTGFNTQTWSYCKRGTPDWNKYLISSSQTVAVENGVLKVRAIKNTNLAADPVPYHTGGIESRGKFKNDPPSSKTVAINKDDWNIYGFNWYPDRIDFTLNGAISYTYPRIETTVAGQWPFDKEFYFILNMAAGGQWGGPVTESHLPFEMQVDWVRVYQAQGEIPYAVPAWTSSKTQNDSFWNNTFVKSITVNGAETNYSYTATQRPTSYYTLLADTLEIYPDQAVELSAEAFSLGGYSTSVVKQDLRYTCAYIFADFDGDRYFETVVPRIGKMLPSDNKGGNMIS